MAFKTKIDETLDGYLWSCNCGAGSSANLSTRQEAQRQAETHKHLGGPAAVDPIEPGTWI